MKLTKIKKIILVLFILLGVFFVGTELCIMKYLKEYGYGIKELPQTTMVYFHLSKGFTVERADDNHSVFLLHMMSGLFFLYLERRNKFKGDINGT